ncbi:DUF456 domain-containing protein [Cellulomonas soli]|uniref:Membrane protein n=1 Tax=Cellulomonas soli TaxID=931535 RepID=A0A512P8V5_9CELL|nr:DUF456 domain-containing protein [Cellulomonas soli]NYI57852.1 hypothetical protein [Cellulomonas soli]GEP67636.1 membrane protein [Cellulomonas soli]
MTPVLEIVVGLLVATGLVGIVVQVLPGGFLVCGSVVVWGVVTGGAAGWTVAVVAVLLTAAAEVTKYLLAGRHLSRAGVPRGTLVWGGLLGIVGFFVVPVVGLPLGFALGVWAAELVRLRESRPAWASTWAALQATGLTILVELAGALLVTATWVAGVVAA